MAGNLPVLKPGSTLGILGGGQLGRMLAIAAARLGIRCHVYSPEPDSCAFDVASEKTCAPYDDDDSLTRFAKSVDLITYEFENVPAETADFLVTNRSVVLPDPAILATTQDRLAEKNFLIDFGIGTAPFAEIGSEVDVSVAVVQIEPPAVLKTRRLGYDGKGQVVVRGDGDAAAAWKELGEVPAILEGFIEFEREISVIAARGRDGSFAAYDPIENIHREHILHRSLVPAALSPAVAKEAVGIAKKIADELSYVGVLTVEMFVVEKDGRSAARQRNRAARAQFRALDDRRREREPVRAAHPRDRRLAARQAPPPRQDRDDQPDRRRNRGLEEVSRRARRHPARLRQARGAAGAQDGACDADEAGEIIFAQRLGPASAIGFITA